MSPVISTRGGVSAGAYGWGAAAGSSTSFESIATGTGTGSSGTITLSSIPATFTHLQLRLSVTAGSGTDCTVYFNGDNGANYTRHFMRGTGTGVSSNGTAAVNSAIFQGFLYGSSTSYFSVMTMDIYNYADTTNYKIAKMFTGQDFTSTNTVVEMRSGLYVGSTSAISSITVYNPSANWTTNTQVALYGIKGA